MSDEAPTRREDTVTMLTYFWHEKGDLERWTDVDREYLWQEFPAVLKAWDDYKSAEVVLSAVMRNLGREQQ